MLQTQTVSTELLELLKKIMNSDLFADFNLVGGTSLALQIGHRNSVDIDMFGQSEISDIDFLQELNNFGTVQVIRKSRNILIVSVNGIKVDFVNYNYPLLEPSSVKEGIRLVSDKDIAAMKLNAIAGRGSKKDFIDLYFLLRKYTLKELMGFYNSKYYDGSEFMVLKSLTYFDDADLEEMPVLLVQISWEEIKNTIISHFNANQ